MLKNGLDIYVTSTRGYSNVKLAQMKKERMKKGQNAIFDCVLWHVNTVYSVITLTGIKSHDGSAYNA